MEKLGHLLGRGYVAEVFAYGDNKAIKLFIEEDSDKDAELEARVTSEARRNGISAPRVWGVVKAHGRPGIVMERVEGESMLQWGTTFPWRIYTGAKLMARMHADLHSRTGADMPALREKLRTGVENASQVEDDIRKLALERLARLPDGDSICHGDFHPDNVIMSKSGPVIIDWLDGVRGHPPADVARTVVLVESGVPLVGMIRRGVVGVARRIFLSIYLREYFKITGTKWEEVSPWMLPVAVNYTNAAYPDHLDAHLKYLRRYVSGEATTTVRT